MSIKLSLTKQLSKAINDKKKFAKNVQCLLVLVDDKKNILGEELLANKKERVQKKYSW